MADSNNTEQYSKQASTGNSSVVADLHVAQIIIALHQHAIAKCKDDLGDSYHITNSAIDESGNTATLTGSGEHIVSVIPTENAIKKDKNWTIDLAVEILQRYVSWFAGPDVAKKITNSTVVQLDKAPSSNAQQVNEATCRFMPFSQFLREADETHDFSKPEEANASFTNADDEDEAQNFDTQEQSEPEEKKNDQQSKPDNAKDEKTSSKENEDSEHPVDVTKLGYYITYEMVVEGLKKAPKINDAMTSMGKSILNYIANFFDDVTITASGIFGSGPSFTVKDIKDKFRNVFGPIDPDELARNVEERIEKKYKGSDHPDVQIKNKRTLVADLGDAISGTQKKQIEKADYSLWIKIGQDDPKKPIFNKGLVADIVQASIKGLWKKFKNRITADDVIHLENYYNIHANTEKMRKLYGMVPNPVELKDQIQKANNAADAISKIDKQIQRLVTFGGKDLNDCKRAQKCVDLWRKFMADTGALGGKEQQEKLASTKKFDPEYKTMFDKFIDMYSSEFNKYEDKDLHESAKHGSHSFFVDLSSVKKQMIQMMFESYLHEEDEESTAVDFRKIDSQCEKRLKASGIKQLNNNPYVRCLKKSDLKEKLDDFNASSIDADFGEFLYGVLICGDSNVLSESSTRSFKDAIMDILFEDDKQNASSSGSLKPNVDGKKMTDTDQNAVKAEITSILNKNGVHDVSSTMYQYAMRSFGDVSKDTSSKNDKNDEVVSESILNRFFNDKKHVHEAENEDAQHAIADKLLDIKRNIAEKVHEMMEKAAGETLSTPSYVAVRKTSEIVNFLKNSGLGSEEQYEQLDKPYSIAVYVKRSSDKTIQDKKSGKLKKLGGSPGNKGITLDSISSVFKNSIGSENTSGQIVDIHGVPSVTSIDSDIFGRKKHNFAYSKAKDTPANCNVYCMSFDIDESSSPSSTQSSSSNSNSSDKTGSMNIVAYVLPFGKTEIQQKTDNQIDVTQNNSEDDVDNKEIKRNDLYIIPMPGLQYEDPEYANKKLM